MMAEAKLLPLLFLMALQVSSSIAGIRLQEKGTVFKFHDGRVLTNNPVWKVRHFIHYNTTAELFL
jgi:hypothetical protein